MDSRDSALSGLYSAFSFLKQGNAQLGPKPRLSKGPYFRASVMAIRQVVEAAVTQALAGDEETEALLECLEAALVLTDDEE